MLAMNAIGYAPATEVNCIGFRPASVPDPSTLALLAFGALRVFRKCR